MGKLFEELTALKKAYDKKLEEEGEEAVKEAFKDLFDKHPRLDAVVWTQYTMYFNDGDPCYFNVYDFDPVVTAPEGPGDEEENDEDEDYDDDEDLYDDDYAYGERLSALANSEDPELVKIAEAVSDLSRELPDDVLESVFGDHCKITATRKGFDIAEYEHD